jgi:hypothetical protein
MTCEWPECGKFATIAIDDLDRSKRHYCGEHASAVSHNRQLAAAGYFSRRRSEWDAEKLITITKATPGTGIKSSGYSSG